MINMQRLPSNDSDEVRKCGVVELSDVVQDLVQVDFISPTNSNALQGGDIYPPDPADGVDRRSVFLNVTGYILVTEFCERLAYYGFAGNLVLFFQVRIFPLKFCKVLSYIDSNGLLKCRC